MCEVHCLMQRSSFTGYLQSAVVIISLGDFRQISGSNSLNEKSICNQYKSSGLLTYFPQPRLKMWILSKNLEINALGSYQLLDKQTTSLRLCMCIIHCVAAGKSSLKIHRGSDLFMKH